MAMKDEGIALPPLPLRYRLPREGALGLRSSYESIEPRCEMCGSPVIATHCKRICLKCGFMTGCSEGI
jgi:hypothetical protein